MKLPVLNRLGWLAPSRCRKGFTLIELLIVAAVTGVILSVGLTGYNRIQRRQIFKSTMDSLIQDLRLAQDKALSGEKIDQCAEDQPLYGFYFNSSDKFYSILASCHDENDELQSFAVKEVTFPDGIQKESGPDSILFKVLNQGIDLNGGGSLELSFSGFDDSYSKTIYISQVGEIYSLEATPTPIN